LDAVIKIGGSILQKDATLQLCKVLDKLNPDFSFVIIPGGGEYADLVRKHYSQYHLSDDMAHWMAILSENIVGFFILRYLASGTPVFTIPDISRAIENSQIPVFLPFQYLFEQDPLPHSWDVTSDSIAAYLAEILHAEKLILLKDVDGIYSRDPNQYPKEKVQLLTRIAVSKTDLTQIPSCIDHYLPTLLKKYYRPCYIVNGLYPERLEKILRNQKTIYTLIEL
jgi:aspartokinase-like uncharacterized kinase